MAIAAIGLAACAGRADLPEPPSSNAVAGLRGSAAVEIDLGEIAADAVDDVALAALLDDAGFEAAIERSYAGGSGGAIRHVEVRIARFATADGAERYRSWLADHARDVIGTSAPAPALAPPSTLVFVHEPDACCPRETATALAVWRLGREVTRVLISGPDADGPGASTILAALAPPGSR
jgi:hypothetical protein